MNRLVFYMNNTSRRRVHLDLAAYVRIQFAYFFQIFYKFFWISITYILILLFRDRIQVY